MSNAIVTENQNTGTTAWQLAAANSFTAIQGYVAPVSVNPGETVTFYVSTHTAGTSYTVSIFRLGWYGGTGGCLKATISGLTGQAQGYWDLTTLQNCPTAIFDGTTHNLETGWTSSTTWTVPSTACTGCYLAVFVDVNGKQFATNFVVKGNTSAAYAYIRPHTTEAAYNNWGGYSLYTHPTVDVAVSLNKPNANNYGSGDLLVNEAAGIHWLEQMGYDVSYLSILDVHVSPSSLLTYQAILIAGHNEYWTREIRDGVEAARDAGCGIAFLGANASYWQCRLGTDNAGNVNRTVTCYKVSPSGPNNLSTDPLYGVDNTRVTCKWRTLPVNRPENTVIGIMYSDNSQSGNVAWKVDTNANSPYLTGTGLVNGTSYGTDLVGYEWDNQQAGGPSNLQIIGSSSVTGVGLGAGIAHTTTYIASGGGLVFATGSIAWTWGLDSYRWGSSAAVVPGMQQLMAHIMTALIRPKNPTGFSAFASGHR